MTDLLSFRPMVIISGDFGARSILCWLAAKLLRAKFIIWSEEIPTSARGRSWLQHRIRRLLATRAHGWLAWGGPARDYLLTLGVQRELIFRCEQAIDNERWSELAGQFDHVQLRRESMLAGTVFLLVGRLVERKGFRDFIEGWNAASKSCGAVMTAIVVGSGDQERELKALVNKYGLTNIVFKGKLGAHELARCYALADVFVFPSLEDVWGLVVNEALCFGLPVMASQFAGSTQDLIADSDLGVVFNPKDVTEFAEILCDFATFPPPIDRKRGQERLEAVTFSHSCGAISDMLAYLSSDQSW